MENGTAVQMGPLSRAIVDRGGAPLAERDPLVRYGLVPSPAGDRAAAPAKILPASRLLVRWGVVTFALMVIAWFVGSAIAANGDAGPAASTQNRTTTSAQDMGLGRTDTENPASTGDDGIDSGALSKAPLGPPRPLEGASTGRGTGQENPAVNGSKDGAAGTTIDSHSASGPSTARSSSIGRPSSGVSSPSVSSSGATSGMSSAGRPAAQATSRPRPMNTPSVPAGESPDTTDGGGDGQLLPVLAG